MLSQPSYQSLDYLVIGHFSKDILSDGSYALGGTSAYAALTARALGLRVGIVTSFPGEELNSLNLPSDISIFNIDTATATTLENIEIKQGRKQHLHAQATKIELNKIPTTWQRTPIIHLGPIVQDIPEKLPSDLATSLLGITPQGWLRGWDDAGHISQKEWSEAETSLKKAGATVLSVEDVEENEEMIEEFYLNSRILAVTEGGDGVRIYWNGDLRRFPAPQVNVVDTTGAGDIFAATFFIRLYQTRDPWEAARFAVCIASRSVTRRGLQSIPTQEEIQSCQMEVL